MSDHGVEDLIEDSVRAVLASSLGKTRKRELVARLYAFQYRFDTSDTYGRLAPELEAIGYERDGLPETVNVLALIPELIEAVAPDQEQSLLGQWLGLLARELAEGSGFDHWPASFEALQVDPRGLALRELAQSLAAHRHRSRGGFPLRSWRSHVTGLSTESESGLDDYYAIRFLLDLDTPLERILAAWCKQVKKNADADNGALTRLAAIVEEREGFRLVSQEIDGTRRTWLFALDGIGDPAAACFHLRIEHERNLSILSARLLVTSAALARWQGGQDAADSYHFRHDYFLLLPPKVIEADPAINPFGGWIFKASASEKTLRKRLDSLFSYWSLTEPLFRFHSLPLEQRLDRHDFDALEKQRKPLRDRHGYFMTEIALMFACACRSWDRDEKPDALIARIRGQLPHVHELYDLKPAWEASLAALEQGADYPRGHAPFPYRYID